MLNRARLARKVCGTLEKNNRRGTQHIRVTTHCLSFLHWFTLPLFIASEEAISRVVLERAAARDDLRSPVTPDVLEAFFSQQGLSGMGGGLRVACEQWDCKTQKIAVGHSFPDNVQYPSQCGPLCTLTTDQRMLEMHRRLKQAFCQLVARAGPVSRVCFARVILACESFEIWRGDSSANPSRVRFAEMASARGRQGRFVAGQMFAMLSVVGEAVKRPYRGCRLAQSRLPFQEPADGPMRSPLDQAKLGKCLLLDEDAFAADLLQPDVGMVMPEAVVLRVLSCSLFLEEGILSGAGDFSVNGLGGGDPIVILAEKPRPAPRPAPVMAAGGSLLDALEDDIKERAAKRARSAPQPGFEQEPPPSVAEVVGDGESDFSAELLRLLEEALLGERGDVDNELRSLIEENDCGERQAEVDVADFEELGFRQDEEVGENPPGFHAEADAVGEPTPAGSGHVAEPAVIPELVAFGQEEVVRFAAAYGLVCKGTSPRDVSQANALLGRIHRIYNNYKAICKQHKECICYISAPAGFNRDLQVFGDLVRWLGDGAGCSRERHAQIGVELRRDKYKMKVRSR